LQFHTFVSIVQLKQLSHNAQFRAWKILTQPSIPLSMLVDNRGEGEQLYDSTQYHRYRFLEKKFAFLNGLTMKGGADALVG